MTDYSNAKVLKVLKSAGVLFNADCCFFWLANEDFSVLKRDCEWPAKNFGPITRSPTEVFLKKLPWLTRRLENHKSINVPDFKKLPPEQRKELQQLCPVPCSALFLTPMKCGKLTAAYLGIYSTSGHIKLDRSAVSALVSFAGLGDMAIGNELDLNEYATEVAAFRLLMNKLPDSVYFKDVNSRFTQVNRALAKRLKAPSIQRMIGKSDFDFFSSEHAKRAFVDEQKVIRTGKPLVGIVEKETFHDGSLRWVSTTKEPVYDNKRRIIGTFGISRDITELKLAQEELLKANDVLEKRVRMRTEDLRKANQTLEHRIEQLKFLNTVSNELSQFIHLDQLYQAIISTFLKILPRAEASLYLSLKNRFSCVYATKGLQHCQGKTMPEDFLSSAALRGLKAPLLIENCSDDGKPGLFARPETKELPCAIVFPLITDGTLIGAVLVFTVQEFSRQYQGEKEVFDTISVYAAVCLGKALHFKKLGEKARLEGELDAARKIQEQFISSYAATIPRISLKGVYYPANEVSGDYLDYFQTPSGRWVIVVADVCGKGVAAALVMAMLRCTFRGEAKRTDASTARELMLSVNEHFMSGTKNVKVLSFVTVLCLVISADGTSMTYSRGGHPPLLRLRGDSGAVEAIACNGIALGMIDSLDDFSEQIEQVTVPLVKGDRFFLYTDGLIEAFDAKRNSYGAERLVATLATIATRDPNELIEAIMTDIKSFTKGAPNHDDLTMLAMTVSG